MASYGGRSPKPRPLGGDWFTIFKIHGWTEIVEGSPKSIQNSPFWLQNGASRQTVFIFANR
jgi:hypothetical protein